MLRASGLFRPGVEEFKSSTSRYLLRHSCEPSLERFVLASGVRTHVGLYGLTPDLIREEALLPP